MWPSTDRNISRKKKAASSCNRKWRNSLKLLAKRKPEFLKKNKRKRIVKKKRVSSKKKSRPNAQLKS